MRSVDIVLSVFTVWFIIFFVFVFFFSSRRRHTRCSRDWSSDVCSSDLGCGATVDCSGAVVAGAAPADFLFGEERTAADGTAAVQLAVSLVCGDGDGRGGVEPRGVQQESGAAAERGDRRGGFSAGTRPCP